MRKGKEFETIEILLLLKYILKCKWRKKKKKKKDVTVALGGFQVCENFTGISYRTKDGKKYIEGKFSNFIRLGIILEL